MRSIEPQRRALLLSLVAIPLLLLVFPSCQVVRQADRFIPRPAVEVRSPFDVADPNGDPGDRGPEGLTDRFLYPEESARSELMVETAPGVFTRYIPTKPGGGDKLAKLVRKHLGANIDHIANFDLNVRQGNDKTDLLFVSGSLEEIQRAVNFLDSMEALAPQIEIEAKVVEINSNTDSQLGLRNTITEQIERAGGEIGGTEATLFRSFTGNFDTADFAEAQTSQRDFQGNLLTLQGLHDEFLVDLIVQALIKEGYAELISSPTITTLDGCGAEIITGDEVPVQKTRVQAGVTFVDITYKKTGVKLNVTPNLVGDNSVQLVVASEVSTITGFTPALRGAFPVPIISTRNAATVINVNSGDTFVIGGLIANFDIEEELKMPLLGDIPLLKYLFSVRRKRKTRSQVLFFLTPRIIYPGAGTPRVLSPQEREEG